MLELRRAVVDDRVFSEFRSDVKIACEGESGGVSACLAWKNLSKSIEKEFSILFNSEGKLKSVFTVI